MKTLFISGALLLLCSISVLAGLPDEGMWLPMLIGRQHYADMKRLGLTLTAEDIYAVNQASLKDKVVGLSEGDGPTGNFFCTAEVVSGQGLIFTNHHCGYDAIQQLSTLENNILRDGFWAKEPSAELPAKGLHASFLVRMDDVTEQVLGAISDTTTEKRRNEMIASVSSHLAETAGENGAFQAIVVPCFGGSEYYLFVYKVYRDVRLVGTPPSSIGKFGGETDNWMWPRYTGDFSVFRMYCSQDGNPADFDPGNKPLKTPEHFPISPDGVHEGDFTMVIGFPATTNRYTTASGIRRSLEKTDPALTRILGKKLETMKACMIPGSKVEMQYTAKYEEWANSWKNYTGEAMGIRKLHLIERKTSEEEAFKKWAASDAARMKRYGNILPALDSANNNLGTITPGLYALSIGILKGAEALSFAEECFTLYSILTDLGSIDPALIAGNVQELKQKAAKLYRDFDPETDRKVLAAMVQLCRNDLDNSYMKKVYDEIDRKFDGDYNTWASRVFRKSVFASAEKVEHFLNKPRLKALKHDPLMEMASAALMQLMDYSLEYSTDLARIDRLERLYLAGLREMHPEKLYYPDANATMRLSFGKAAGYKPADAVDYQYFTSMDGMMAKEDSTNEEYRVPKMLKTEFANRDFGKYGENGTLRLCFTTDNDITGGNSGSPVINAKGELIGLAFDGNWEAMSSDLAYEPDLQRAVCVDIRYVLFVIDKIGGARNLINELTIR